MKTNNYDVRELVTPQNSVLLVYECDAWLSRQSMYLLAVCTNRAEVRQVLLGYEDCTPNQLSEILTHGQSQCGSTYKDNNFIVEEVEINKLLLD